MAELNERHREIATELVLDAARDIEFLTVVERLHEVGIFDEEIALAIHDAASRATVEVELNGQRHVAEFREDGWTLKHPLACRPNLFDCALSRAAEFLDGPPAALGRYPVELDQTGLLVVVGAEGDITP